ncbi:hypothetical protein ABFS82_03G097700 [Erythranthe guttata]|uniref:uncharacterized protein LOC105974373 n=1 Tax=Erythranthe guttata TaxID=4155 RepID=UPI00064DAF3C|nr:PREDICTED: uncharacterized protein LOC105974373 [Erythranthe guttata]|eukprot:XP_012854915.1 PREDICTED: uncharacterized protein LOC105974373 [Erythranthe guttata]
MGCSGSKAEDLPLVVRCRERREFIRAAANHRYALAAAHVSYFRSLKDVGDALRKFVDEELVAASQSPSPSSSFSSPSLILPPSSRKKRGGADESSLHLHDDDDEASHIHLSDSSSSDVDSDDYLHLHHNHNDNHHHGHKSGDDTHRHHTNQKNFNDEVRHLHNEAESSSHYPRSGPNGYGNEFGDGLANDPYRNPYSNPYSYPYPYQPPPYVNQWDPQGLPPLQQQQQPPVQQPWYYSGNSNMYYMKKSAPAAKTVVQEPPSETTYGYSDSYWNPSYGDAGYGSNYGYFPVENNSTVKTNSVKEVPPPPSPKASAWDFFDPFNGGFENGYPSYYTGVKYGYGSNPSSPDSSEVREMEGIPDLEEETESEVYKEVLKTNRMKVDSRKTPVRAMPVNKKQNKKSEGNARTVPPPNNSRTVTPPKNETSSRSVPLNRKGESKSSKSRLGPHRKSESSSKSLPSWSSEEIEKPSMPPQYNVPPQQHSEKSMEMPMSPAYSKGTSRVDQSIDMEETAGSVSLTDEKSSPENVVLKSVDEGSVKKKGVTFEVEESSKQDGESSMMSSLSLLSTHGNRDLREVVAEIRDEFETASSYGKEVAMMLEVGKMPYQPSLVKVILSRMFYLVSPSLLLWDPPPMQSANSSSDTTKSAKSYFEDVGKDVDSKACNLSSILDKLYAWETKLYKEVKDEERLRIMYEKQCKRLKYLDEEGAESAKIDATRASIRRLLTKLDVSIRAIDAISMRIHKLRDEELQPQVASLIHGLTRMWKSMLKCHQKQFQAVMDSKMRKLKANTRDPQTDPTTRATTELERELLAWSLRFKEWIRSQKSYVDSLNNWLLHCLHYEPEQTSDGPAPYSPGRIGAPPIFVICHDWHEAMDAVSEAKVENAMNSFATRLRQLWEKQDEEGRQRVKAEFLSKDYKKHLNAHQMEKEDTLSVVQSENGVSPLDDLKVDLDSMREKLAEERVKHKDAMKLVHDAASSSLQGGLVPIFKALESFTSEALKAHEHVRLQHPRPS